MGVTRGQKSTRADANSTVITTSWAAPPAPGSKVILWVWANTATAPSTVADNGSPSRTFTLDASKTSATPLGGWIYRADNVQPQAGTYTVTVTFGASVFGSAGGLAYQGVVAGAPGGTNSTGPITGTAQSSGAVTGTDGLFVALLVDNSNGATTITLGGGFSQQHALDDGTTFTEGEGVDLLGGGSQTASWTLSISRTADALIAYWDADGSSLSAPPEGKRPSVLRNFRKIHRRRGNVWALQAVESGATTYDLDAADAATSAGTADLTALEQLAASGAATSSGSAALTATEQLAASGAATSSGSAAIGDVMPLAASGAASSTGSGAITITSGAQTLQLAASGAATSSGSAALTELAQLAATGASSSSGSAAITARSALAASGAATSAGSGVLLMTARLAATGAAQSTGAAALRTLLVLAAAGAVISSGSAALILPGEGTQLRYHVDTSAPGASLQSRARKAALTSTSPDSTQDTTVRGR
jgi:hypothetical protein